MKKKSLTLRRVGLTLLAPFAILLWLCGAPIELLFRVLATLIKGIAWLACSAVFLTKIYACWWNDDLEGAERACTAFGPFSAKFGGPKLD